MTHIVNHIKSIYKSLSTGNNRAPEPDWQLNGRVVLLVAFAIIVLKNAYVCEDAYITFRTVDNWLHGFGLRWNVDERIQVFTHPLWMFAISAVFGMTRENFYSVIFFSLFISVAAVWLYTRKVVTSAVGMFAGVTLLFMSRAFIDFSSSGLENPLYHLFIVAFMLYWHRLQLRESTPLRLLGLSLLSCLSVLTRMDTALIFFPAMLLIFIDALRAPNRKRLVGAMVLGFTPFILWELFSLFYYGFLFPNTYYAKMSHGIPKREILLQGFFYVRNAFNWDPVTLITIITALVFGLRAKYSNRYTVSLALGILLYVLYVVSVGGDHMSGRFFTAPFMCAVILLTTLPLGVRFYGVVIVLAILLGLNIDRPTLASTNELEDCRLDEAEIVDERGCCRPAFSLHARNRKFPFRANYRAKAGFEARARGRHSPLEGMAGIIGFYAGPKVHIVDPLGLADPLLARLPVRPMYWRIAHFIRNIPEGYREAAIDEGEIKDPDLAKYYEKLNILTRGDLWSLDRLKEIWKFNTGEYEHYRQGYCRRQFKVESCDQVYVSRYKKKKDSPEPPPKNQPK